MGSKAKKLTSPGKSKLTLPRLRVMISSRCNDSFPTGSTTKLSETRSLIKEELQNTNLFDHRLFDVWINEDQPPTPGLDSWDVCMSEVDKCDILIVLFNGNAGWSAQSGGAGICHGEFSRGFSQAPGKVRLIVLGEKKDIEAHKRPIDLHFRQAINRADRFRGAVKTPNELVDLTKEAVAHAVADLAKLGVRETRRGQYHLGEALEWTKLDYASRAKRIVDALRKSLLESGAKMKPHDAATIELGGVPVFVQLHSVPGAMSVPEAREMLGRPFLQDHQHITELKSAVGPFHLVGCNRTITETQAADLLGFPDAMIVRAPFGIYVADDVQKIQFALLENCRDEVMTRIALQRFTDWLTQSGEAAQVAARGQARKRIVEVIASEI